MEKKIAWMGQWYSEEKDLTLPPTNPCINLFKKKEKNSLRTKSKEILDFVF